MGEGASRIAVVAVLAGAVLLPSHGAGQQLREAVLAEPLALEDVIRHAARHRQEITAARAQARAAALRPAMDSALEDPMVMMSIDHLPFMLHGVDASLMVEQRFPLSGMLTARGRAAGAEADRQQAVADRVEQDVLLDAAESFLMLRERRQLVEVLEAQLGLSRELVAAANARYAAGVGPQADVLRAEIEVAGLDGTLRGLRADVDGAEAMFNASIGRPPDAPVPRLSEADLPEEPPSWPQVRKLALERRPELAAGKAEVQRAQHEVDTMDAMYWPMAVVRAGPAYTMGDGWGAMAAFGISVPIFRERLRAGVGEARAMVSMARADLAAMTRMIEGEAASARAAVLAARARAQALRDDVLPRARLAIEPTVAAYAAGMLPLVSVLDALQTLFRVQAALVAAQVELDLATVRLRRAQGLFGAEASR